MLALRRRVACASVAQAVVGAAVVAPCRGALPATPLFSNSPRVAASGLLAGPTSIRLAAATSAAASATGGKAAGSGETALDVAMKVNKLKRMHQSGQGQGKKEIEMMAWRELNTLSEAQIATAEGKAVALLLNAWAYFARFWETGKDGPLMVATQQDGGKAEGSSAAQQ